MSSLDKTNVAHGNAVAGAGIQDDGCQLRDESVIGHFGANNWDRIDIDDLDAERILADAKFYESRWHGAIDDVRWATHRVKLVSKQPVEVAAGLAKVLRVADEVGSVMLIDYELGQDAAWGWPLRVFNLPESVGSAVAAQLDPASTPPWFDALVDVMSVDSPNLDSTVDFVFVANDNDTRRYAAMRGLRVNAVVVAGVDANAEWLKQVHALAKQLGAVALLIPELDDSESLAHWLIRLIEHLTHRNSIDVAMGKSSQHGVVITSDLEAPIDNVVRRMRDRFVATAEERGQSIDMSHDVGRGMLPEPLRFDMPDEYFGQESAGASRIRELREANEFAVDLLAHDADRYLQAAITRLNNNNVRAAFKAGETHEFHIWIGNGATGFLRAKTATGDAFVVDQADLFDGAMAEIVIWGDDVEFQSEVVRIGRHRMSETASFAVDVARSANDFEVNLALVLNGRIAQGGVIRGPVTPQGGRARREGAGEIEFVVGPEALDLSNVQPDLRAGIVTLIEHGDTLHDLGAPHDDTETALFERQLQEREIVKLGQHLERSITALVEAQSLSKKSTWFASSKGAHHFAKLARTGFAAFRELVRSEIGDPTRRRAMIDSHLVHLAVFGAEEGRFLPELLYDRPPPKPDAEWCNDFDNALATGSCSVCTPWDPTIAPVDGVPVCPAGFWAVRKEIERVSHRVDGTPPTLHNRQRGNADLIGGLDRIVIGASDRVDKAKIGSRKPTTVMNGILSDAGLVAPRLLEDWTQWVDEIEEHKPQVLVLLTHSENDSLELGANELYDSIDLWTGLVREPFTTEPAGPIVLLVGCETGVTKGLSSFAELFRNHGASVVIGTSGTTLGRFAAPIAGELIAALNNPDGPPTIGATLLEVRRRTLAKGWVTGLLMMAFTDGAYLLER